MTRFCFAGVFTAGLVWTLAAAPADAPHAHAAHFVAHSVGVGLRGGYAVAVADLNHDARPDIVAVASQLRDLIWYENPTWTRHVVASGFTGMINVAPHDVDGDGFPELALAHGFSMNPATSTGVITLLTHLGDPTNPWIARDLDRVPTTHRIRWADVDGHGRKALVAAPLVGPEGQAPDFRGQTPLVLFRPGAWKREVIAATDGLVHGILVFDWNRRGRDAILTAGFSGVHLDELADGAWQRRLVTSGDPAPWPKSGASDVAIVRLGNDRLLATIEPWHGNEIVIYRMTQGAWDRHVIDSEATDSHTIGAFDVDGRGRDAIVVGQRQGKRSLYLYSALDDAGRDWQKEMLDDGGMAAAGCATADLNRDQRVDVVCISPAEVKWYENTGHR